VVRPLLQTDLLAGGSLLGWQGELRRSKASGHAAGMRALDVIESELRPLAAVRRHAAEIGAPMARIGPVDELLDEWLTAHRFGAAFVNR
jgi:hypothetical protein